jgi:hypothetical protein
MSATASELRLGAEHQTKLPASPIMHTPQRTSSSTSSTSTGATHMHATSSHSPLALFSPQLRDAGHSQEVLTRGARSPGTQPAPSSDAAAPPTLPLQLSTPLHSRRSERAPLSTPSTQSVASHSQLLASHSRRRDAAAPRQEVRTPLRNHATRADRLLSVTPIRSRQQRPHLQDHLHSLDLSADSAEESTLHLNLLSFPSPSQSHTGAARPAAARPTTAESDALFLVGTTGDTPPVTCAHGSADVVSSVCTLHTHAIELSPRPTVFSPPAPSRQPTSSPTPTPSRTATSALAPAPVPAPACTPTPTATPGATASACTPAPTPTPTPTPSTMLPVALPAAVGAVMAPSLAARQPPASTAVRPAPAMAALLVPSIEEKRRQELLGRLDAAIDACPVHRAAQKTMVHKLRYQRPNDWKRTLCRALPKQLLEVHEIGRHSQALLAVILRTVGCTCWEHTAKSRVKVNRIRSWHHRIFAHLPTAQHLSHLQLLLHGPARLSSEYNIRQLVQLGYSAWLAASATGSCAAATAHTSPAAVVRSPEDRASPGREGDERTPASAAQPTEARASSSLRHTARKPQKRKLVVARGDRKQPRLHRSTTASPPLACPLPTSAPASMAIAAAAPAGASSPPPHVAISAEYRPLLRRLALEHTSLLTVSRTFDPLNEFVADLVPRFGSSCGVCALLLRADSVACLLLSGAGSARRCGVRLIVGELLESTSSTSSTLLLSLRALSPACPPLSTNHGKATLADVLVRFASAPVQHTGGESPRSFAPRGLLIAGADVPLPPLFAARLRSLQAKSIGAQPSSSQTAVALFSASGDALSSVARHSFAELTASPTRCASLTSSASSPAPASDGSSPALASPASAAAASSLITRERSLLPSTAPRPSPLPEGRAAGKARRRSAEHTGKRRRSSGEQQHTGKRKRKGTSSGKQKHQHKCSVVGGSHAGAGDAASIQLGQWAAGVVGRREQER